MPDVHLKSALIFAIRSTMMQMPLLPRPQVLDPPYMHQNGTLAAVSTEPQALARAKQPTREDAHDPRRCFEVDQRKRGEIRRSPLYRHNRQGAPRHHPNAPRGRGLFQGWQDVRRFV